MSTNPSSNQAASSSQAPALYPHPKLAFDPSTLPVGQLESLRFKANQLVESIQSLTATLALGLPTPNGFNPNMLPPWPDILAKYSLLVSQTHTLSQSLNITFNQPAPMQPASILRPKIIPVNPFQKIVLHPGKPLEEEHIGATLLPLLRTKPDAPEDELENLLVARLRRSQAFASSNQPRRAGFGLGAGIGGADSSLQHEETLRKCSAMRQEHDARADRAARAVSMLREKFDTKARVEIEFPPTPPLVPLIPQEEVAMLDDPGIEDPLGAHPGGDGGDETDGMEEDVDPENMSGTESSDDPDALDDMIEEMQGEAMRANSDEDLFGPGTPASAPGTPAPGTPGPS
jgi:hypothetical protein